MYLGLHCEYGDLCNSITMILAARLVCQPAALIYCQIVSSTCLFWCFRSRRSRNEAECTNLHMQAWSAGWRWCGGVCLSTTSDQLRSTCNFGMPHAPSSSKGTIVENLVEVVVGETTTRLLMKFSSLGLAIFYTARRRCYHPKKASNERGTSSVSLNSVPGLFHRI